MEGNQKFVGFFFKLFGFVEIGGKKMNLLTSEFPKSCAPKIPMNDVPLNQPESWINKNEFIEQSRHLCVI